MKRYLLIAVVGALFGGGGIRPASAMEAEVRSADSLETRSVVVSVAEPVSDIAALSEAAEIASATPRKQRFLPVRRRIDREIDKVTYVYKGELMMGLTASYGTLTSDDTDFLVILENINASGTIATVKPYFGYFYRNNRCFGVRFGYTYVDAKLDAARLDLGEGNDVSFDLPYIGVKSNNYAFGVFHRS